MLAKSSKYRLELLGSFGFFMPGGERIEIASKKGIALIALLATGKDGVRTRGWLQDILWGSRATPQAQASLRKELSNLRGRLNSPAGELLTTDHSRVRLDLGRIDLDLRELESGNAPPAGGVFGWGEFLEGLDIAGEDAFEDWLRQQRASVRGLVTDAPAPGRSSAPAADGPDLSGLPQHLLSGPESGGFLGRPVLAVLPFANLTGDSDNDYLGEGIAEDMIEQLSRLRWLPIIARGASFAFSTERHTLREIGMRLGARYVLEGRLRQAPGGFNLTATAADAETSRVLWARRLEIPASAPATELGGLVTEIVGALSNQIDDAEMGRAVARSQSDLNVHDLIWRARWHHYQYTVEDSRLAEALIGQALAKEPHSPEAIITLADFRQRQIWMSRGEPGQILELRKLAQRAIAADCQDGRGYMIAGIAELWLRHSRAAITLLEQAIALNPSLAYAYSQLGAAHYLSGEPEAALDMLGRALRLNMSERHLYYLLAEIAMAKAMSGRWDEAVAAADQSIARRPAYWYAHVVKIHALLGRGDRDAAAAAAAALRAVRRDFEPGFIDWVPFVDPGWNARLKASVVAAATPGGG
jgi:TolB-like protein